MSGLNKVTYKTFAETGRGFGSVGYLSRPGVIRAITATMPKRKGVRLRGEYRRENQENKISDTHIQKSAKKRIDFQNS